MVCRPQIMTNDFRVPPLIFKKVNWTIYRIHSVEFETINDSLLVQDPGHTVDTSIFPSRIIQHLPDKGAKDARGFALLHQRAPSVY